jgi:prephenate dehydrogenase
MPRILIIGLGLMGGSAGIALRRAGWHVAYLDARVPLAAAVAKEAADEKLETWRDEEVVLLATHVDAAVAELGRSRASRQSAVGSSERQIASAESSSSTADRERAEGARTADCPTLSDRERAQGARTADCPTGSIITSLCSVMRPLRAVAPANFIAGHPMAGSHESGLAAARGDLYEGKKWFVDAHDERVERLVRDCGGVLQRVDAETHDRAVALTSHLPQLLSTALAAHLHDHDVLDFAGSGLRDFLRLSGSGAEMWGPIVDANREQIAPHAEAVAELVRAMLRGDRDAFAKAQRVWKKL